MINPLKHHLTKTGWKLNNYSGKPVLCGSKTFRYGYYNPNFRLMESSIREYMRNEFGRNNYIVSCDIPPIDFYNRPKSYKPDTVLFNVELCFKVNTSKYKEMFVNYEYVFNEVEKIIDKYGKEEET